MWHAGGNHLALASVLVDAPRLVEGHEQIPLGNTSTSMGGIGSASRQTSLPWVQFDELLVLVPTTRKLRSTAVDVDGADVWESSRAPCQQRRRGSRNQPTGDDRVAVRQSPRISGCCGALADQ